MMPGQDLVGVPDVPSALPPCASIPGNDVLPLPLGGEDPNAVTPREIGGNPDLWLYRDRTVALLRRYFRISVEVGRLPSLLGREFFRARVTAYRVGTFEDAVIFVHDMEKSLEKLDSFERELIGKIVLQEYSQDEAARLLGCWRRTIGRRYSEALDRLSEIFLAGGLLTPLPQTSTEPQKSCQEGEIGENSLSSSEQNK